MIECFQKRDNDIADDREGDENIECTADTVALVADLDDVKYFFFHSGYFYNNFWVNVFPCWYKRGGYYSCRYYYCIIFRHPLQSFWCLGIISVGNLKR